MARVPTLDGPQVQQRGLGAPTVGGQGPDNSGLQRGMAQIGQAAQQFVDIERQKADTAALMQADQQLETWQQDTFFNPETGVYTKKGGAALDITNQTIDQFEQQQTKIAQSLNNDRQRARYADLVNRRRSSLSNDLNRYEYREREQHYDDVEQGQIETSLQSAALNYGDPDKVAYYQNKMAAVVQSQAARKGLPAEMTQANLLKANSAMSSAVISRMTNDDPYKARSYFEQAQGAMTAEDQVQIDRLITREIKSRELEARQMQAIARAEVSSRIQDAQAAYLQGLDFAQPPSRQEMVNAYGGEEGAQRYDQMLKLQGLSADIREFATADPEQQRQIVEQYNPAPGGVAGEGFREDAQMYGTAIQAITALEKEKAADPASYVAKYSPIIRDAIEGLSSGDPAAAEAYAAATIAEQQRLGVAQPQLLSKRQVDSIALQFEMTEDGGSNAAEMITQLQGQWGKYWPDAYKQLSEKLPGAALVIGSGVDEATAATLARIAPLKTEELKRGLDSTDVSDGRATLQSALAPLRQTLAQQAGGDRTYATIDREAERLMLAYMVQGNSVEDAANKVTKALVDDKYTIKGSWRAPIQYDADMIERGSELALQSIAPESLSYAVPAGVTPEFAAGRVKAAIDKDGYWVTLPDESGLALYYGGAAVLDKSGAPVTQPWESLIGTSQDAPSAWQRFNDGRQRLRDAQTNPQSAD